MTRQQVINAVIRVSEQLRPTDYIPNPATRYKTSTGKLAFEAFIDNEVAGDEMFVYIDEKKAPYMPYTNEPWIDKRWNGKKNPNEGWWQRFVAEFVRRLAAELKGELKE